MRTPAYSLGFLLTKLGRITSLRFQEKLEPLGITPLQSGILATVSILGPQKQKDLCKFLIIDKASMNQMLKALESLDLVKIEKDAEDRRAWAIAATVKGKKLMTKIARIDTQVSDEAASGLSQVECDKLVQTLTTMLEVVVSK